MARVTIKSLQQELALEIARHNLLKTQYDVLEAAVFERARATAPKGACVVIVNGVARASTLNASAAFKLMTDAKALGHRAQYRPYH